MIIPPINFRQWIDENRHLLKPPVGNKVVYEDTDFIIMVVGGPNNRKDYHYNEGEEFFYQIEGDIKLPIIVDGKKQVVEINEGDIFLLPPKVPHSPQRGENTVGLVIERKRKGSEIDACMWFCENCDHHLHTEEFSLSNIVTELPQIFEKFYSNDELTTCSHCGTKMQKPNKL